MDLFIDPASDRGLSAQLYQQIRDGIAAGRLRPGDQLLPSRHVAQQLGLSRHTVTTAYGRLAAEGFTQGRAGGGSVVAGLPAPAPGPAQRPAAITPGRRFAGWAPEPGLLTAPDCRFDLRAGIADAGLFPADAWRRRVNGASAAWPDRRRPVTRPGSSSYGGPSPAGPAGPGRLRPRRAR